MKPPTRSAAGALGLAALVGCTPSTQPSTPHPQTIGSSAPQPAQERAVFEVVRVGKGYAVRSTISGRDPIDGEVFGSIDKSALTDDGGIVVSIGGRSVAAIDRLAETRWRVEGRGPLVELAAASGVVLRIGEVGYDTSEATLYDLATGREYGSTKLRKQGRHALTRRGRFVVSDTRVDALTVLDASGVHAWAPDLPAPGDPGARLGCPALAATDDGGLGVGREDGTVALFDESLRPGGQVALRGDIEWLTPAGGLTIGWTRQGVVAAIAQGGTMAFSHTVGWGEAGLTTAEDARASGVFGRALFGTPHVDREETSAEVESQAARVVLRHADGDVQTLQLLAEDDGRAGVTVERAPEPVRGPPESAPFAFAFHPFEYPSSFTVPPQGGGVWVVFSGGISQWTGHGWTPHKPPLPMKMAFDDDRDVSMSFFQGSVGIGGDGKPWLLGERLGVADMMISRAVELDRGTARSFTPHPLSGYTPQVGVFAPSAAITPDAAVACIGRSCWRRDGATWRPLPDVPDEASPELQAPLGLAAVGDGLLYCGGRLARFAQDQWHVEAGPESCRSIAIVAPDDRWVLGKWALWHGDGQRWQRSALPMVGLERLAVGPGGALWAAGKRGLLRYDGQAWHRALGPAGGFDDLTFDEQGTLWLATAKGVWQGEPRTPAAAGEVVELAPGTSAVAPAPDTLVSTGVAPGYAVQRIELPLPRGGVLDAARELDALADGSLFIHDGERAYRYAADKLTLLVDPAKHSVDRAPPAHCHDCLAATGNDTGVLLGLGARPHEVGAGGTGATWAGATPAALWLEAPAAVAASRADEAWVVGTGIDDTWPRVLQKRAGSWRYVSGLPPAGFVAVAADGADAWIAGGLGTTTDGTRVWPSGAGLLCHVAGPSFDTVTVRSGALLAVASARPGAAWAVGAAGTIVAVDAAGARSFVVPGAPWLRAVLARAPNDVWIGGDDSTLLHWDGASWSHIDPSALGQRVAVTSIAPGPNGGIWATGPAGIWEVKR